VLITVIERKEDIHFLITVLPAVLPRECPTGPDHMVPDIMISLSKDGATIIKNSNKEFLSLGGPGGINLEYTPKGINLCGAGYSPDEIVSVKNYRLPTYLIEEVKKIGPREPSLVSIFSRDEEISEAEAKLPELSGIYLAMLASMLKKQKVIKPKYVRCTK
jgi:hypothetical protein